VWPYIQHIYLGLARTIYIRCIHDIFGRETTNYTDKYGLNIYGSGQPYVDVLAIRPHSNNMKRTTRQLETKTKWAGDTHSNNMKCTTRQLETKTKWAGDTTHAVPAYPSGPAAVLAEAAVRRQAGAGVGAWHRRRREGPAEFVIVTRAIA
jgi:hypothetical protein